MKNGEDVVGKPGNKPATLSPDVKKKLMAELRALNKTSKTGFTQKNFDTAVLQFRLEEDPNCDPFKGSTLKRLRKEVFGEKHNTKKRPRIAEREENHNALFGQMCNLTLAVISAELPPICKANHDGFSIFPQKEKAAVAVFFPPGTKKEMRKSGQENKNNK